MSRRGSSEADRGSNYERGNWATSDVESLGWLSWTGAVQNAAGELDMHPPAFPHRASPRCAAHA
eukprot:1951767-Pleurochrysis_carterae.AAC.1